ncbi:2OG-Fe(II) oxygenase [Halobacteriovorax sp. HLS]|uniref:2OG-Fe(II) oxygenase n=1 Tax=Halobacteriovorax sp. HLS TaxID=2234000 RepID=UPI000FDCC343|nr:2OG-Fe(II) oxygenase [Halobacteriovorax sp. HLS]
MSYQKEQMVDLILDKLTEKFDSLREQYFQENDVTKTKFFYVDDLLPVDLAEKIFLAFPEKSEKWRRLTSFRENKCTSKSFDDFDSILRDITFAFQDNSVIQMIEKITEIPNLCGDDTLYAGGLSMMSEGHFLNPHIDNSHNQDRTLYRRANLLFYVTPEWKLENGGNIELWNTDVSKNLTIESKFNRLVVMETNDKSWHSVSKVVAQGRRCCVSNYYFSETSPKQKDYFHITAFNGRPTEKLKRLQCFADNLLRTSVRKVLKKGIGKKDLYKSDDKQV